MQSIVVCARYTLALVIAGMLAAGPALADKPPWAGGGTKQEKQERHEKGQGRERDNDAGHDRDRQGRSGHGHFVDQHRVFVREYYSERLRAGTCPPGLAKKHHGCMPPGQAQQWQVGRPLPREVVYYALPPALVVQLGQPPTGHRYVRVVADILLIAVGTGMVVDAMQEPAQNVAESGPGGPVPRFIATWKLHRQRCNVIDTSPTGMGRACSVVVALAPGKIDSGPHGPPDDHCTSTRATPLTVLVASTGLPSGVTSILRTM